jgi:hypothetical protein
LRFSRPIRSLCSGEAENFQRPTQRHSEKSSLDVLIIYCSVLPIELESSMPVIRAARLLQSNSFKWLKNAPISARLVLAAVAASGTGAS